MRVLLALTLMLLAGGGFGRPAADSAEWAGWRGPAQTGVLETANFRFARGDTLRTVWKRTLGSGYSSVSVVRGHAVTLFGDGRHDYVIALDPRDGSEQWRVRLQETFRAPVQSSDGPASTPAIAGGRVFALGPRGTFVALDLATGRTLWSHDLAAEFGAEAPYFGFVGSPVVVDDLVCIEIAARTGSLLAFDVGSGGLVWSAGDDSVTYQTPVVATLGGQRQIVFAGDRYLHGVKPDTGEVLWKREHRVGANPEMVKQIVLGPGDLNPICPVIVGTDGILLVNYYAADSVLFRVTGAGGRYVVEEAWRNANIRKTYAVPIVHGDDIFGFTNRFATCIDARTGETKWRSRPPGDGWLIGLNGHLVFLTKDEGELRVVRGSAEAYQDLGGAPVLDGVTWTPPSYGQGLIYVRNFREIAAVEVRHGEPISAPPPPRPDSSAFGAFVERVLAAPVGERSALVDAFLAAQDRFPIVEGERSAHIVFRGDVEDVAIEGDMLEIGEQKPMTRVDGTDLYYASFDLEPDARVDYRISKDYKTAAVADPLNPRRIATPFGERSELVMPRWTAPPFATIRPTAHGTLESLALESRATGGTRRVAVYLPPGYRASTERYPVLYVTDGSEAREFGKIVETLDVLVSTNRIKPVIAVLLEKAAFELLAGKDRERHAEMLAAELVPRIDSAYRTQASAANRILLGADAAGFAAFYAALRHPSLFGGAAGQSTYLFGPVVGGDLETLAAAVPRPPLRFYVAWSSYDMRGAGVQRRKGMMDWRKDSMNFARMLSDRGYDVAGAEFDEGWGWSSWRNYTHRILEFYFTR